MARDARRRSADTPSRRSRRGALRRRVSDRAAQRVCAFRHRAGGRPRSLLREPAYVARRGSPSKMAEIGNHDCIVVSDGGPARWPSPGERAPKLVPVSARLSFTSFAMAHAAALAGLGIALFPEFACADDLRRKRLVPVLGTRAIDVGSVWILYPAHRFLPARVRAFVDLARERFAAAPPWEPSPARR